MTRHTRSIVALCVLACWFALQLEAAPVVVAGQPGRLEVRAAGEHGVRITLQPAGAETLPFSPALVEQEAPAPAVRLDQVEEPVTAVVGELQVEVRPAPLTVVVSDTSGRVVQELAFDESGAVRFRLDDRPVLGMGEGGPVPPRNWREQPIEFDRRGRMHTMRPRWQANSYGSRNPVAMLVGAGGWGLFIATPWGQVDLRDAEHGEFTPWEPPATPEVDPDDDRKQRYEKQRRYTARVQGRPPVDGIEPGVCDVFVFDAARPEWLMKDVSSITGPAVLPPKWALGYMQSHRTLEDDRQMVAIVDTFREKQIPVDAVIYLGTGFCPRGWNTMQPSLEFNPEAFTRDPAEVIDDLHARDVKVVLHVVPEDRDQLPTLQGSVPPKADETVDESHIATYWREHTPLVEAGADAWWPDEGDWFNLFERVKRHQLYYQGPLSTQPNTRPWSLHRNGYLGVAKWGGWVWSGDTDSAWKTLEGQVAVGVNHSLSLSPFWGSDIGGFYPNEELTGELYARWFQFGAFCPSFRSHGRTWWTRLPWGWGLEEMGPVENGANPLPTELNNPAIEPVCKQYAELRYQLLPYVYTMAWEARETGMPMMRALWLHYSDDEKAAGVGDQYLWGRELLVAPVYTKGATSRDVYLPEGEWYDFWTNEQSTGPATVTREVDLATMPIYVRAGAIVPFDPVRQHTSQEVSEPTTIRVYRGADGEYTLYDDDGVSLDYLRGESKRTRFTWDDGANRLVVERLDDGDDVREFRVELLPDGVAKNVVLESEAAEVAF